MVGQQRKFLTAGRLASLLLFLLCSHCVSLSQAPNTPIPIATPAPYFNELFSQKNGGWTGGDGTLSIGLPSGRNAWLFGDTFLGQIRADGTRSRSTPFIRNCLVIQNGDLMKTRFRTSEGEPSAYFGTSSAKEWYWPGDGTVVGSNLEIFLHRFRKSSPQLWGWNWTGTFIATLSMPALEVESINKTVSENSVMYGVSILETDPYTYIYGIQDSVHPKFAHLARAPTGFLQGPWSYCSEDGWSDDPLTSTPILSGVSTQYAVIGINKAFYLITMECSRSAFSDSIAVYRATNPRGPWQGPQIVYRVPNVDHNIVAYNPFVHTQFAEGTRQLISYNQNHIKDPSALYKDASIYRPRFVRVDLAEVERRFSRK